MGKKEKQLVSHLPTPKWIKKKTTDRENSIIMGYEEV